MPKTCAKCGDKIPKGCNETVCCACKKKSKKVLSTIKKII